jgi:hypothetical protein
MPTTLDQLQAMRDLPENWDGYGAASPQPGVLDLAREFAGFLEVALRKSAASPCELQVSPTRVGGVLIQWETPAMEHEIDITPDHGFGFLHLDKATGQITTRKLSPDGRTVVDPGLLQELRQLLAA